MSRDLVAHLRARTSSPPRSPEPGARNTDVTTKGFLMRFWFAGLSDRPNLEALDRLLIGAADADQSENEELPVAAGPGETNN